VDLQLTGKRAVVTGGSRGIGFAIAGMLAAEGADVALLARDPGQLEVAGHVAVAALTKTLADELGPCGINVTVVHPGMTVTERTPAMLAALAAANGSTGAQVAASMAGHVSIGRFVTAAEVADVVAFLASPRSVAINGDAIAAGGGTLGAIHY
jgi:NAD(P)-dependent dehydrogenase (short-subunit alcohol dehydrogenase family)